MALNARERARQFAKAQKAKQKNRTSLLALGEGAEKSHAFRIAQALAARKKQGRIIAIDLVKPNYEVPQNMAFVQREAIGFLEGASPQSVKRISDDYFFQLSMYGKRAARDEKMPTFTLQRNELKYMRLARRALVFGGRFIITTDEANSKLISRLLAGEGFRIAVCRELKPEEVQRKGSPKAKREFQEGNKPWRIVAVKPKQQAAQQSQ